jgi:hypothetical protein
MYFNVRHLSVIFSCRTMRVKLVFFSFKKKKIFIKKQHFIDQRNFFKFKYSSDEQWILLIETKKNIHSDVFFNLLDLSFGCGAFIFVFI